jgi:hypothetical protein
LKLCCVIRKRSKTVSSSHSTDRIEKQIRLSAPRSRVRRSLTDPGEFGQWFGVNIFGESRPAPCCVDG